MAAAIRVILFFLGAFVVHTRAHYDAFVFPGTFLVLAVAALGLGLIAMAMAWSSICSLTSATRLPSGAAVPR